LKGSYSYKIDSKENKLWCLCVCLHSICGCVWSRIYELKFPL